MPGAMGIAITAAALVIGYLASLFFIRVFITCRQICW